MNLSLNTYRRAKSLLGTLVEISVRAETPSVANESIDAAFARMTEVHQRLSFHDETSDLSRVNEARARSSVNVSADFIIVLKTSLQLAERSGGIFNPLVAPKLQEWGILPAAEQTKSVQPWHLMKNISLKGPREVLVQSPVCMDFGGIAKGYAVDCALETLKTRGINSALVNAGGDVGVYGEEPYVLHLRDPALPWRPSDAYHVRDVSVATSGTYFSKTLQNGQEVCALVDGRTALPALRYASVTIAASRCIIADALTKVAAVMESRDLGRLLQSYDAHLVARFESETGEAARNQASVPYFSAWRQ